MKLSWPLATIFFVVAFYFSLPDVNFAATKTGLTHPRFYAKRSANETNLDVKGMIEEGKQKLEVIKKGFSQVVDFQQSAVNILSKLATIMQGFGPQMAAVGMILSLITAFLPEQESAELKYMKEQFEIVNTKLDAVLGRLDDVEYEVEYQGAKVSFGPYSRKIASLKRSLQFILDSPDEKKRKMNSEFFLQTFTKTYEDSAHTVFNALMGEESQFYGYDLLDVTSKKLKCNIHKLYNFCVLNGKLLGDAISVEGAYFGLKNMTYRANSEGAKWEENLKKFGERCKKVVKKCNEDWREVSTSLIQKAYNENAHKSNAEMASAVFKTVTQNVPQRAWAVWVYNDVGGFDPHSIISAKVQRWFFWHKHNKCVTIDSTEPEADDPFDEAEAKEAINLTRGETNNCNVMKPRDAASRIVKRVTAHMKWRGGAYYAIQQGIGLEYRISEKHFHTQIINKYSTCSHNKYRHHVFVFY